MNSNDICKRALKFVNNTKYVYWFGGKNQLCTSDLLSGLIRLYPNIYTPSYIAACKTDIQNKRWCIDCSGLVCSVYKKPQVGTYSFKNYFKLYDGKPQNGMILWRNNHTGIYYNGHVIEARGRFSGITSSRPYRASDWSCVYIDEKVTYSNKKNDSNVINYNKIAKDVIAGKYGNGQERIDKLTSAGYDASIVQKYVNKILRK